MLGVHTYTASTVAGTDAGNTDAAAIGNPAAYAGIDAQLIVDANLSAPYEAGTSSFNPNATVSITIGSWDAASSHITGSAQAMFTGQLNPITLTTSSASAALDVMLDVQF